MLCVCVCVCVCVSQADVSKSPRPATGTLKQKPKLSVTEKFLRQLASLSEQLDATQRHYIRCIRPNSRSVANVFDGAYVLEQVRARGL